MNSSRFLKLAGLAVIAAFAEIPEVRAAVMVSNLNETPVSSFPVGQSNWWAGNQFITDASAASFQLDSVTLSMDTAMNTGGGFFVAIYSNGVGEPGTQLELLSGVANPATAGEYTYTSTGLTLAPNTSYWVVAGISGGTGIYPWKVENDAEVHFTGPWQIPSTDTHITSFQNGGDNWRNDLPHDGFARLFSVSATAIPEPATMQVLLFGGVAAVIALARSARRRFEFSAN